MTSTIPVDSTCPAPAAPFTNPASSGQLGNAAVEALVVTSDGQLGHVARDSGTDAGWKLVRLFGGVPANEVVAGTAYANTSGAGVYGLFQAADTLSSIQLQADGSTWSEPTAVSTGTTCTHWRPAYSQAGRLLAYGQTYAGDLIVAYQPGTSGPFVTQTYSMQQTH